MNRVVLFKYCGFFAGVGSAFVLSAFLPPEDTGKYAAILSGVNILMPLLTIGLPTMIIWAAGDEEMGEQVRKLYCYVKSFSISMLVVSSVGVVLGYYEALFFVLLSVTNLARSNAAYVRINRSSVVAALYESMGLKIIPASLFLFFALFAGLTLWGSIALQALCALVFVLGTHEYGRTLSRAAGLAISTVKIAAKKAGAQFIAVAAKEVDSIIALALMDASVAVSVFLGKRAYAVGSVVNESSRLIYQPNFSSTGKNSSIASHAYWTARKKNISFGTIANIGVLGAFLLACSAIDHASALLEFFDVPSEPFGTQTQIVVAIYLFARCVENIFGPVEQYLVMQDFHTRAALVNVSTVLVKGSVLLMSMSDLYFVVLLAFARTIVLAVIWKANWIPKMEFSN